MREGNFVGSTQFANFRWTGAQRALGFGVVSAVSTTSPTCAGVKPFRPFLTSCAINPLYGRAQGVPRRCRGFTAAALSRSASNETRANENHIDAIQRHLPPQTGRYPFQPMLGRGVSSEEARPNPPAHGRNIDDLSARRRRALAGPQQRSKGFGHDEGCYQVHLDLTAEFRGGLHHQRVRQGDTCIIDQAVEYLIAEN
jgi:hypothetical protein